MLRLLKVAAVAAAFVACASSAPADPPQVIEGMPDNAIPVLQICVPIQPTADAPAIEGAPGRQRVIRTAFAAIALASWGYGTPNFDGPPPLPFQRDNSATIVFTDPPHIAAECKMDTDDIEGCSDIGPVFRKIWITNPCRVREHYAQILCHELGHVNGWPANHPR